VRTADFSFFLIDVYDSLISRDLSERLNLSRDEGEKWIVNLIRETRMGQDAKIDLEKVLFNNSQNRCIKLILRHAECHRDSPASPSHIPDSHRKDAWAHVPNASDGRCHGETKRAVAERSAASCS
jgi:hypothetical protein